MKKEAINTFGEGIVMDLHPLTTPANVLTNCLNGTTITYNGNEFVLQNDMGNGEVHTAYLDRGYVPVGMKEHGGIIYIAAHNPVSGKSQIGSFPSPQQLYEGDDINVATINVNFSELIPVRNGIPFIETEYYKRRLFEDATTGNPRKFHPGDKFIIVSDIISPVLRKAINEGIIKLQLGVINTSGAIDYIDNKSLKIYDNGLWIYENSNTPLVDVLKSNEYIQVFSSKSSGALILVIEVDSFDTFNLLRKYSYAEDTKNIKVELIGETTGKFKGKTTVTDDVKLYYNDAFEDSVIFERPDSSNEVIEYSVAPTCPYGVLSRMAKSGLLDFSAIRSNKELFNEWRFYITETYVKIGWGYDYYNLNEDSSIEKIVFTFIDINSSNSADIADSISGTYNYNISKEYFNGSFEEIIPFGDSTIRKDWVYIVRIGKYTKGVYSVVGYRLLYTGGYFNDIYATKSDFTTITSKDIDLEVSLDIKSDIRTEITSQDNDALFLKTAKGNSFVPKSTLRIDDYITIVDSATTDITDYQYTTRKVGTYNVRITPSMDYDYNTKMFAGKPKSLETAFDNSNIRDISFDNSDIKYNSASVLNSNISEIVSEGIDFKWDDSLKAITGKLTTSRSVFAESGTVKISPFIAERLVPVYRSNMTAGDRDKLFSFKEDGNVTYCTAGDNDDIFYNTKITGQASTTGSLKGENAGAGNGEDGIQAALLAMSNNAIIGIMAGVNGDDASLWIQASRGTVNGWRCGKNEVDDHDNFMIATWKDSNNRHWPINLISRKTESNIPDGNMLIRVEKMLKCFLSQMLVVQTGSAESYFTAPNSTDFVYNMPFDTVAIANVSPNASSGTQKVEFYLGNDPRSIETHLNKWKSVLGDKLTNFIPTFTATVPTSFPVKIEYGKTTQVDSDSTILSCYTNAYSYTAPSESAIDKYKINRGWIYVGQTAGTANTDGSMNLVIDPVTGLYKTVNEGSLVDWVGRRVELRYNINDRFINNYSREGKSGEVKEDYFNSVFIRANVVKQIAAEWTKGRGNKNTGAPDMAVNIGFGYPEGNGKSLYWY